MNSSRPHQADRPRYIRVRDVVMNCGISKPKVFQLLRAGSIQGFKVDGILFIDSDSVDRWLKSGKPWSPRTSS